MDRRRVETKSTLWEFDLDRMVYTRFPKNESPRHPFGGKPYEGHEVEFTRVDLGVFDPDDGMQQFFVANRGVKWGAGAVTTTWAVAGSDLSWVTETDWSVDA